MPVLRDRPPLAAVRALAPVVAHHEVVALRDRDLLGQVAQPALGVEPDERLLLALAVEVHAAVDRPSSGRPRTATTRLMKFVSERPSVGPRARRLGARARPHRCWRRRPAGGLNTTMSPRSGSLKRKLTRSTSTRCPISRVGTIDSLGMRNGLTRKAWMPSARPSATATIVTSSTSEPAGALLLLDRPPRRSATGPSPWTRSRTPRRRRAGVVARPRRRSRRRPRRRPRSAAASPLGERLLGGGRLLRSARARRPPRPRRTPRRASAQLVLAGARRRRRAASRRLVGLLRRARPAPLADPRAATHPVAQVVELRPAHVTASRHLDPLDLGRVHRERSLHSHAEGLLADGERLAQRRSPGA